MKTRYFFNNCSNLVMLETGNQIYKVWEKSEFTEKKKINAMKKLASLCNGNCVFIDNTNN